MKTKIFTYYNIVQMHKTTLECLEWGFYSLLGMNVTKRIEIFDDIINQRYIINYE